MDKFRISRGLRQGYPLSPLLFNLVAEGLSVLLERAASLGFFHGIKVENDDTQVTHLQFTDDLIIFYGASATQVQNVKRVMWCFELAAGLELNLNKTSLFGINIEEATLVDLVAKIRVSAANFPTTYLGLPLGFQWNSLGMW
ncbi:hypothetical protein V6N11_082783 [Hibiscus sabdariffa]|uniref:Reverse transcriptase domain-containing protein n=1 Tax=Hibiscus sabdariffa TaxID=183260 RepID=A0ABR2QK43_9ROSI